MANSRMQTFINDIDNQIDSLQRELNTLLKAREVFSNISEDNHIPYSKIETVNSTKPVNNDLQNSNSPKRGRGRPKFAPNKPKSNDLIQTKKVVGEVKRGRGRPSFKSVEQRQIVSTPEKLEVKRGRGRPAFKTAEVRSVVSSPASTEAKRGRGRPAFKTAEVRAVVPSPVTTEAKRGRGRPAFKTAEVKSVVSSPASSQAKRGRGRPAFKAAEVRSVVSSPASTEAKRGRGRPAFKTAEVKAAVSSPASTEAKRGRGRPAFKTAEVRSVVSSPASIEAKRGRGRPAFKTVEVKAVVSSSATTETKKGRGRPAFKTNEPASKNEKTVSLPTNGAKGRGRPAIKKADLPSSYRPRVVEVSNSVPVSDMSAKRGRGRPARNGGASPVAPSMAPSASSRRGRKPSSSESGDPGPASKVAQSDVKKNSLNLKDRILFIAKQFSQPVEMDIFLENYIAQYPDNNKDIATYKAQVKGILNFMDGKQMKSYLEQSTGKLMVKSI